MNLRFCSLDKLLPYLFYLLLAYLLMLCWRPAQAQSIKQYKNLQIGDTVPDVTIDKILHYKTPTAQLSDFKGKLLILDFWATWCSPCLAMIPRMDSLQAQFNGRVQFLPIAYQTEREVTAFMKKYGQRLQERIVTPEVVEDKVLKRLFYHNALPHYVWIDEGGVVVAITDAAAVNASNLAGFLKKKPQVMDTKKDQLVRYDRKTPLLVRDQIDSQKVETRFQSALTGYIPGLAGGYHREKTGSGYTRITLINASIPSIARSAFGEAKTWFGDNRIVFEVKDSTLLMPNGDRKEWFRKNAYCYEIVVPAETSSKIFSIMQSDFHRFFSKYEAGVESRYKKCLALVRTSRDYQITNVSSQPAQINMDAFGCELINCPLSILVDRLNFLYMQLSPFPLIDQSGMAKGVDLKLNASLSDIKAINAQLDKYGLAFIEKVLPIDVLVIKDAAVNPALIQK